MATVAALTLGWDAVAEVTLVEAERLVTATAKAKNSFDTDKDTDTTEVFDFGSFDKYEPPAPPWPNDRSLGPVGSFGPGTD